MPDYRSGSWTHPVGGYRSGSAQYVAVAPPSTGGNVFWGGQAVTWGTEPVSWGVIATDQDRIAPTLVSATITDDGASLVLQFSEAVTGSSGFELTMSGGAVTISLQSGAGTSALHYLPSRLIKYGEVGAVSYTPGSVQDAAGNPLAALTAAVDNLSTLTELAFVGPAIGNQVLAKDAAVVISTSDRFSGAVSYALTGTLPAGMSFDTVTGAIYGRPTTMQTKTGLKITGTDLIDTVESDTFSISVVVQAAGSGPGTINSGPQGVVRAVIRTAILQ